MPLYGNELDRDDEPVRGRPRPGREARQARRLRRPGRARAGRRRRARRSASSGSSSTGAASPATATRSTPATGGPASSPAAPSRRPSACRSRWPTSRPADAEPGTMVDVEIRDAAGPRRGRRPAVLPAARPEPAGAFAAPTAPAPARSRRPAAPGGGTRRDGPHRPALHQGPRVGPRRRRRGDGRDHRLRRRPARRHRLRRAARRRPAARASSRRSAWSSRSRRSATCSRPVGGEVVDANDAPGRRARARQQRPVRRGLDDPGHGSPTPAEVDELLDAAAYDALIAAG